MGSESLNAEAYASIHEAVQSLAIRHRGSMARAPPERTRPSSPSAPPAALDAMNVRSQTTTVPFKAFGLNRHTTHLV